MAYYLIIQTIGKEPICVKIKKRKDYNNNQKTAEKPNEKRCLIFIFQNITSSLI
jgi:hypothetical protein